MKRRSFITLLGGAAAWPLAARAPQGDRVRRIGVLAATTEEVGTHVALIRRILLRMRSWQNYIFMEGH